MAASTSGCTANPFHPTSLSTVTSVHCHVASHSSVRARRHATRRLSNRAWVLSSHVGLKHPPAPSCSVADSWMPARSRPSHVMCCWALPPVTTVMMLMGTLCGIGCTRTPSPAATNPSHLAQKTSCGRVRSLTSAPLSVACQSHRHGPHSSQSQARW